MKSFCFFNSGWKFPPKIQKKQQWLFQSLLLRTDVPGGNWTHNYSLGGYCYIHLTTRTNAVFSGFFDPLAPAAIIYNSITSVMNYLFLISSDFSDFASLSDPQTLPFFFKWVPSWFYLRRRVLYPAELYGHMPQPLDFTGFLGFFPSAIYKIINSFSSCQSTDFFTLVTLERSPNWGMLCCHLWHFSE